MYLQLPIKKSIIIFYVFMLGTTELLKTFFFFLIFHVNPQWKAILSHEKRSLLRIIFENYTPQLIPSVHIMYLYIYINLQICNLILLINCFFSSIMQSITVMSSGCFHVRRRYQF